MAKIDEVIFFDVTNLQDKTVDKINRFNKEDWSSAYQNVEKELTKEPLNSAKVIISKI